MTLAVAIQPEGKEAAGSPDIDWREETHRVTWHFINSNNSHSSLASPRLNAFIELIAYIVDN